MFISKFSVEKWAGPQNKGVLETVQGWTEIETAIRELDGHYKTLVTLEGDDETHMAVGGGLDLYVVYVTFDNETFHYLVDLSKPDTNERLTVGGQEGIYPVKLCVGISAVLKAARTFAEFGKMDKSLTWEQDRVVEPV
jgi:Immunity protein Imm1